jgi:hypothetical protein
MKLPMNSKGLCLLGLLAFATPGWSAPYLLSTVSVPVAVTNPPPASLNQTITSSDSTLPLSVSTSVGGYSASAFAQSDFGVLRAAASSFIGFYSGIYGYGSGATSQFGDDLFLNVPVGQQSARVVFGLDLLQTHELNINGGEGLYFGASFISRPGSGVGLLGHAHCGTSGTTPGAIGYGGSYGSVQNLNIPLSGTCTLDVPVTAGELVKLELSAFVSLTALGREAPSMLDATNTVKVTSTGWVDGAGRFTAGAFTGVSGTTYPTATVPEPGSTLGMLSAALGGLMTLRRRRKTGTPPTTCA